MARRKKRRSSGGGGFSIGGIFRSMFSLRGVIIMAVGAVVVFMVPTLKDKVESVATKIKGS